MRTRIDEWQREHKEVFNLEKFLDFHSYYVKEIEIEETFLNLPF